VNSVSPEPESTRSTLLCSPPRPYKYALRLASRFYMHIAGQQSHLDTFQPNGAHNHSGPLYFYRYCPPVVIPVTALSIPNGMFAVLASDDKFTKLCLSKDNWPVWSKKMLCIMKVSELDGYLSGCIPKPDVTTDPVSQHHWVGNNNKLVGFLEMYVDDRELPTLVSDNAHTVWTNLVTRHEKQAPITQVRLIQEVLSISYSRDVTTWQATTDHMRDHQQNYNFLVAFSGLNVLFRLPRKLTSPEDCLNL
jgi:hypothetical protein